MELPVWLQNAYVLTPTESHCGDRGNLISGKPFAHGNKGIEMPDYYAIYFRYERFGWK